MDFSILVFLEPTFVNQKREFTIREDVKPGTSICTLTATDEDGKDMLVYTMMSEVNLPIGYVLSCLYELLLQKSTSNLTPPRRGLLKQ